VFLDFDGTLSPIVARPELAALAVGVIDVVRDLTRAYAVVAVISGRRTEDVRDRVAVDGVTYAGLYGLDEGRAVSTDADVERAIAGVEGAWLEAKGPAVTVHYRQAPDPSSARASLLARLGPVAAATGRRLVEGKRTVELVPHGVSLKGGAVRRLVADLDLEAAFYAGDDLADLEAFSALDDLERDGGEAVRVAVRGAETPQSLVDAADVSVDGPEELVALLRQLVPAS
jgi:trehalose 6-phosphate phosphatase